MQAKTLLERTGCPEHVLKDWVRKKVILPARPGGGAGVHAEYDEANAVALLIGLEMKQAAITVAKYAAAFAQLHEWLRNNSSLTWSQHFAVMSPTNTLVEATHKTVPADDLAVIIPLTSICSILNRTSDSHQVQRPLLGLQSIRSN